MASKKELFKFTKWLMLASGIWRLKITIASGFLQNLYKVYSITSQIIYDSVVIMFIVEFYRLYTVDRAKAVENLSRLIFVVLLIVKLTLCQSEKMIDLLSLTLDEESRISAINDPETQKIYRIHVKYSNSLTAIIAICSFSLAIYLTEMGFESNYKSNRRQKFDNDTLETALAVQVWYPFDKNKHFGIVMAHQTVEILLTALYSGSVHAFSNSVMIYLRAQLKILQHYFRHFHHPFDRFENDLRTRSSFHILRNYCRKHQKLINWIEEFNGSFKYIMFLEYCVSSLLLAAVIFQIFAGIEVLFNTVYLVLIICQLMALAWNADEILVESTKLSLALYESEWYNQDKKVIILIHFMMQKCRTPLTLNIGAFGPMTVSAALSRFKLAYSYVSVMSSGTA
ncbi:uncharacterized protein LOC132705025 isoform X2 [Cylas formicarius]|uniref:uncharacterized protein LOC132705025 isoform X2 n=1 Tax=Cylas formicarius TaxID=197179 RepID=UPI0029588212|nr:uncharacterized protein LOC132705025 isoform X2 [Cylas formicarius]